MRSHNMAFPSADLIKTGFGQLFISKQLTLRNQFLVLNWNPVSVENGGSVERWLGVGHWLDLLSCSYWYIQASGAKMTEGRVAVGFHGDGGPGSGGGSVVAEPCESAGVLLLLSG